MAYQQPSAADLRAAAQRAADDAQIADVMSGDAPREQMAREFDAAHRATISAARQLPADVKRRVIDHADRIRNATTAAETLRRGIPTPRLSSELGPYTPQHTYDAGRMQAAQDSAEAIYQQATQGTQAEADAITRDAWLSAIPGAPDRALAGRVQSTLQNVQTGLQAGRKPADVLAAISDDPVAVHAMLGSQEGQQALKILGADVPALARQYGEAVLKAGGSFPGSGFLAAQGDEQQSLSGLAKKATDLYAAHKARATSILGTRAAKAARGGNQ